MCTLWPLWSLVDSYVKLKHGGRGRIVIVSSISWQNTRGPGLTFGQTGLKSTPFLLVLSKCLEQSFQYPPNLLHWVVVAALCKQDWELSLSAPIQWFSNLSVLRITWRVSYNSHSRPGVEPEDVRFYQVPRWCCGWWSGAHSLKTNAPWSSL